MNIAQAIKTAIGFEERITEIYKEYAERFKSETGAKVFRTLGKEEEEHVDYLKLKLSEWEESGKIRLDAIDSVVPDEKVIKTNIDQLKNIASRDNIDDEIEYFQKALEMEKKTSSFYRDMVSQLSSEYQPLFQRFLEIEEAHESIVKAEIDHARGMGFWFDFMEFDQEA